MQMSLHMCVHLALYATYVADCCCTIVGFAHVGVHYGAAQYLVYTFTVVVGCVYCACVFDASHLDTQ